MRNTLGRLVDEVDLHGDEELHANVMEEDLHLEASSRILVEVEVLHA